MSKKAATETIFELMDQQDEVIQLLRSKEKFENAEEWKEAYISIRRKARGFLSEQTRQLLWIIDEGKLWKLKRYIRKLLQMLERDFDVLRQEYTRKGYVFYRPIKQPLSIF